MRERTGKKKSRLETWLKSSATPVFLVSATRRVLFFNTGCETLSGWTADDVVGEIVEFASDSDSQSLRSLVNALCPPPETFAGCEHDVPVYMPSKIGSPTARLIRFVPVRDTSDQVTSVLGIISMLPTMPIAQAPSLALRYHAELSALRWSLRQRYGLKTVIARSPAMRRVLEQIQLAKKSHAPVHFVGPRGSGKEHLARAIHHEDEAQGGSFVPLDCRQPVFELTQALQRLLHPEADDSPVGSLPPRTVFLIDVNDMPRDVQERLLDAYRSDIAPTTRRRALPRLLSSSTESLRDAVTDERLLPELFYLLTTLTIEVPPLRDRREDLELLATSFLESLNRNSDRQIAGFTAAVWPQFREYQWPGNLDELTLVVREARQNVSTLTIDVKDLPLRFRAGLDAQSVSQSSQFFEELAIPPLEEHLAQVERDLIQRALVRAKHNKTLAAKLLGIPRPVLYRRMEALGMSDQ